MERDDALTLLHGAVRSGNAHPVLGLISPAGEAARERLAIYHHHYLESLADALGEVYPVTRALVGEKFFRQVARQHARENPPSDPRLSEYGGAFDRTLEQAPGCKEHGYLPDVAGLEWAVHAAACAPPEGALSLAAACQALEMGGGAARVRFIAAMQLFSSPWAVDQIWQAHHRGDFGTDLRLEPRPAWLVIARDEGGPYLQKVGPEAFYLRLELKGGATLAEAAEATLVVHPQADLSSLLAGLLGDQTIAEIN